jgi:transcriptional regulator with XRE-family HTH domain
MAEKIEPFYAGLGTNIQAARERLKMTQAQLGSYLIPPTTRASVANIERGKQRVLVHTLVQLSKVLKIKVEALLPSEAPTGGGNLADVENELKRKLNMNPNDLKKLAGTANKTFSKDQYR